MWEKRTEKAMYGYDEQFESNTLNHMSVAKSLALAPAKTKSHRSGWATC